MAVNLLTPILSTRTRSINFFNGRLLAGEDLTTEQQNNRVAHSLLGEAIGDGVVYGLEVTQSTLSSTIQSPVLAITQGLAINRNGAALLLDTNTEIRLVRPSTQTATTPAPIFQDCTPAQSGPYIAGAGVYLLTVGPATATEGLAEVSGLNNSQAACNSGYNTQGVQFRLIPVNLTQNELDDTDHLRNLVAYKCFGVADQAGFLADPFGTSLTSYGLLGQLRSSHTLTDCDVPLAMLYWTADQGIVFVDMWSVRRAAPQSTSTSGWSLLLGARRLREAEAEFFQFEDQIEWMLAAENNPPSVVADSRFAFLPAVGIMPITGQGSSSGFDPDTFFGAHASSDIATTDADLLRELFHDGFYEQPIQLSTAGKVQLYLIWENLQSVLQGTSTQLALVFASSTLRYRGIARFGTAKWSLSRFAPRVI